jgi:hypothetical protein
MIKIQKLLTALLPPTNASQFFSVNTSAAIDNKTLVILRNFCPTDSEKIELFYILKPLN